MGLKRECAKFTNIREMIVDPTCLDFITSCTNLESLTFRDNLGRHALRAIKSYGAGLKRVAGVNLNTPLTVQCEFMDTPSNLKQPLNGIMSQMRYGVAQCSRK